MMLPASYHTGFAPRDGYPVYPELWRDCVGAWAPCLGPTGLTLRDWSGRQNHGTLTNMVPGDDWVVNGGRYAIDFDGVDDFINVTNRSSLRPSDGLTVAFWLRLANVSGVKYLVDNQSGSPFYGYSVAVSGAQLAYTVAYDVNLVDGLSNSNLSANTWFHVAVAYDKQNLLCFINGRLDRSQVATGQISYVVSQDLSIGARQGNRLWLAGNIDDILIYERALSASEIRVLSFRRGIAYEMYRPTYYTPPISARRRKILTGQV